jgi:hypothetical protein
MPVTADICLNKPVTKEVTYCLLHEYHLIRNSSQYITAPVDSESTLTPKMRNILDIP